MCKCSPWLAMLGFPAAMVASEYLVSLWQGTFGNTGYTQLKNLPILQLAALTGLWEIGFTVYLFSAGVAAMIATPAKLRVRIATALAAYCICILLYGFMRLHSTPEPWNSVLVGLVETHAGQDIFPPDAKTTFALLEEYASAGAIARGSRRRVRRVS